MKHHLKTWPAYFDRLVTGEKNFEVRKNDRDFQTGDTLILQRWNPEVNNYTGDVAWFKISYILHGGQFGIEPGYCVMGLVPTDNPMEQA